MSFDIPFGKPAGELLDRLACRQDALEILLRHGAGTFGKLWRRAIRCRYPSESDRLRDGRRRVCSTLSSPAVTGWSESADDRHVRPALDQTLSLSNGENGGRKQNEQHRHYDDPSRSAENEGPTLRRCDGGHVPVLSLSGGPTVPLARRLRDRTRREASIPERVGRCFARRG